MLNSQHFIDFNEKYKLLSNNPSPYTIKDGIRIYRDTLNLVPDKLKIIAIENQNNELVFSILRASTRTKYSWMSQRTDVLVNVVEF